MDATDAMSRFLYLLNAIIVIVTLNQYSFNHWWMTKIFQLAQPQLEVHSRSMGDWA